MKKIEIKNDNLKSRIRSKEELSVRKKEFLQICYLLDKLNIRYFLQGGVLLGAIRNNDFIPWDWDAEVSVFTDEVIDKFDLLLSEINNMDFTIKYYFKDISKLKIEFFGKLSSDVTSYTIMGWSHDEKKKIFWRTTFKIPEHFLLNMQKIKFLDKYHLAQTPPEKYLEYQYGDWKKPLQTSNKYLYMRKEYSGMNINLDRIKKLKYFLAIAFKKFYKRIKNIIF